MIAINAILKFLEVSGSGFNNNGKIITTIEIVDNANIRQHDGFVNNCDNQRNFLILLVQ